MLHYYCYLFALLSSISSYTSSVVEPIIEEFHNRPTISLTVLSSNKAIRDSIAKIESNFQLVKNPHLWDSWGGGCYGIYQIHYSYFAKFKIAIPASVEEQNYVMDRMIELYDKILPGGLNHWEGKVIDGVLLTRCGIIGAMHLAPYGTIQWLESNGKINFGNGLTNVKLKLKYYGKQEIS